MSHFLATFEFVVPGAKSRASGQRLDRERGDFQSYVLSSPVLRFIFVSTKFCELKGC